MAYVRPKVLDFAGRTPEEIAEIVASLDDATFNALAAAEAQMRQYLHFREFARAFWKIAAPETSEVVWSPYLDAVCDELQSLVEESDRRRKVRSTILARHPNWHTSQVKTAAAMADVTAELGHLPRLRMVILIPPRHGKSIIVQRLLPAWRWLHRPQEQILALTCVDTLLETNGMRLRDVVRHEQYKELQRFLIGQRRLPSVGVKESKKLGLDAGQSFGMRIDQSAKEKMSNTAGGSRAGHVLGGAYTGVDADMVVIDDPHDIDDGLLETSSEETKQRLMREVRSTYKDKVQDRLNEPIFGMVVLIMQRVHPMDLADYMISRSDARLVCLPTEFEPDHPHRYAKDWRTEPGELLSPARITASEVREKKAESPHGYATKYQMRPSVPEGGVFKRAFFTKRYGTPDTWRKLAHEAARQCEEVTISVDSASSTKRRSDFTSMGVWGRIGAKRILLDRVYGKFEIEDLCGRFDDLVAEWPEATFKLIEFKSSGIQLYQMRNGKVSGCIPVTPVGDKSSRAGWVPFKDGNALFPNAPWIEEYVQNMAGFGVGGAHDDDVDMTSQVMHYWATAPKSWLTAEHRNVLASIEAPTRSGDALRWGRPDPRAAVFVGVVPGWAMQAGSEACAVFVNVSGEMLCMIETVSGGVPAFVASVVGESERFANLRGGRWAEIDGHPTIETIRPLLKNRVRMGIYEKTLGQRGAGYRGEKSQVSALWGGFLALMAEGRVKIRDDVTLATLETVVEADGIPSMADGKPIRGRALALLLALQAMREDSAGYGTGLVAPLRVVPKAAEPEGLMAAVGAWNRARA